MTCSGIAVGGSVPDAISYDAANSTLLVNPHKLPSALSEHLSNYVQKLNDPSHLLLRANFEKRFDMEYAVRTASAAESGQSALSDAISLVRGNTFDVGVIPTESASVQNSGVESPTTQVD
jgi:hypothetical protein